MDRQEGKKMLATLLLAASLPLAVGGAASRALGHPAVNQERHLKPYRELLAELDRTVGNIRQEVWAQSDSIDWNRLVPAPPPADAPDPADGADAPTAVPALPAAPLFNLYLGGIVWKTGQHYAIVNEQVLTSGEMIEGFRVLSIEPSRVTFADSNGQTYICDFDEQLRTAYPDFSR